MADILQYRFITPYNYAASFIYNTSPLTAWLVYGKLAENPIVEATTYDQAITPSGENRYLESVTIKATS